MAVRMNKQTRAIVRAAKKAAKARYLLRLYVSGMTPRSTAAIRRVSEFCEKHLDSRYELEIIDIYQKPALMKGEQIVAVPTLIKELPSPLRRFIGDMHSEQCLLFGLDLKQSDDGKQPARPRRQKSSLASTD